MKRDHYKRIGGVCLLLLVLSGCERSFWVHNDLRSDVVEAQRKHHKYCPVPLFHPVPTQPVFGPQASSLEALRTDGGTGGTSSGRSPVAPTPSDMSLPPAPEPLPPPPPETSKKEVQSQAPQELNPSTPVPPSWVFAPPTPEETLRKMDRAIEIKTSPDAKSAAKAAR